MSNRHLSRTLALQTLYEWDFHKREISADEILQRDLSTFAPDFNDRGFTKNLVTEVIKNQGDIDSLIKEFAPEWPIEQITVIDRNILRIGIYELKFSPEIPPKVAINEAVELAKTFGGESSGKFVNGVLGTIYKEMQLRGERKIEEEICAGCVVYRKEDSQFNILLILDPYNHWTFPKGHQEENESLEATAARETKEETGLSDLTIQTELGKSEFTVEDRKNKRTIQKIVTYFLAETHSQELRPEAEEKIKDAKWFSPEEATKNIGYENIRKIMETAFEKLNINIK